MIPLSFTHTEENTIAYMEFISWQSPPYKRQTFNPFTAAMSDAGILSNKIAWALAHEDW